MLVNNHNIALARRSYNNHIRCILIGLSGAGKTSFLNSLIGAKIFPSNPKAKNDTQKAQGAVFDFNNVEYLFVDMPGKDCII